MIILKPFVLALATSLLGCGSDSQTRTDTRHGADTAIDVPSDSAAETDDDVPVDTAVAVPDGESLRPGLTGRPEGYVRPQLAGPPKGDATIAPRPFPAMRTRVELVGETHGKPRREPPADPPPKLAVRPTPTDTFVRIRVTLDPTGIRTNDALVRLPGRLLPQPMPRGTIAAVVRDDATSAVRWVMTTPDHRVAYAHPEHHDEGLVAPVTLPLAPVWLELPGSLVPLAASDPDMPTVRIDLYELAPNLPGDQSLGDVDALLSGATTLGTITPLNLFILLGGKP